MKYLLRLLCNALSLVYSSRDCLVSLIFLSCPSICKIYHFEAIITYFRKAVNEARELLVQEIGKRNINIPELLLTIQTHKILIEVNGDVVYIQNATNSVISEPIVLMRLDPVQISQSHLIALSLVCNSIVVVKGGFHGSESHEFYPIGAFADLGAWAIVTSDSHGIEISDPTVSFISQLLRQWLRSIELFRLNHLLTLSTMNIR